MNGEVSMEPVAPEAVTSPDPDRKRSVNRIAVIMIIVIALAFACQIIWGVVVGRNALIADASLNLILQSFITMYIIALPIGILLMKRISGMHEAGEQFTVGRLIRFFFMTQGVSVVGNLIGSVLSIVLTRGEAQNLIVELGMDTSHSLLKLLLIVLAAPFLEELFFRKLIIDRTRQYGEKAAVVFSAILFALYHLNLFQFFYTFGMGLVWGYLYLRSGRLRYSYAIHVVVNFLGIIVGGFMVKAAHIDEITAAATSPEAMETLVQRPEVIIGMLLFLLYALVTYGIAIAGIILLIVNRKMIRFDKAPGAERDGAVMRSMMMQPMMIILVVICVVITAMNLMA